MNIAQYQAQNPNFGNTTIKVILTNVNNVGDANTNILSYFSAWFNKKVTPGDWIWAPGVVLTEPVQRGAFRSQQICTETMSDAILAKLTPVSSTNYTYWNVTSGVLNCTTVDNKPFGVQAGLKIKILLLRINSQVPTNLITPSSLKKWKIPLSEQTKYIATEPEIVNRIQAFMAL